jgi:hypothetical protein
MTSVSFHIGSSSTSLSILLAVGCVTDDSAPKLSSAPAFQSSLAIGTQIAPGKSQFHIKYGVASMLMLKAAGASMENDTLKRLVRR